MSALPFPDRFGLALIGYRGTGKSTVGRLLAERLGREFIDADEALEVRFGRSIRSIFESDGEPIFRDREEAMLAELTARPSGRVLATGGGVVLREANRSALKRFGHVVWLVASPTVLADRLRVETHRPALTAAGTLAEIADVLTVREPFYRELADTVIDTERRTPHDVADEIINALTAWQESGRSLGGRS